MQLLMDVGVVVLAYILGAIPFGLIIVKLANGKDVRQVASGRTGGTNVMRAAGCWAGTATALFDIFKGMAAVWLARTFTTEVWLQVLAPVATVLGHNYSIFLMERNAEGKIRLRGGAGGAPTAGGALGLMWPLWWPMLVGIPVPFFMLFGVGFASLATISISITAIVIFSVLYFLGYSTHWQYIIYGALTFCILVWALRPNIRALREGRERFHGWRPWRKKQTKAQPSK